MTAVEILKQVIREKHPGLHLDRCSTRIVPPRPRIRTGEKIGEEFLRRYLVQNNITLGEKTGRTSREDMQIEGQRFEVKTASEGTNRTFQFNHIRLDRNYKYLPLSGYSRPGAIVFGVWSKGDVAEGAAGSLVRMAEGQSVTFKLTKKADDVDRYRQVAGVDSGHDLIR